MAIADPAPADDAGLVQRRIVGLAGWCARHPWIVVLVSAVLTVVSVAGVVTRFAIDTDTTKLIAPDLPWRERGAAFDAAFPQRIDLIAIVIDGRTPEIAERASALLAERLAARSDLLQRVRRPDGGPFFSENGLLFLDLDELARTVDQLVGAQAVLGTLAADPSVRGLMRTLQLALTGVERKDTTLEALRPGLAALAPTLESVEQGRPQALSWRAMVGGRTPDPRELRRFVLVQPVLDFTALKPGEQATRFIRDAARTAGLDPEHGVRVRLTGGVPMADEEFATLEEHAGLNATIMLGALLAMLWLAVRSVPAMIAIVACLIVGLATTAAAGLAIYGAFNLISVAFAVLFVGLGVDFGIQYAVAYRAAARVGGGRVAAVERASRAIGTSLALAAVSIAIGFFAFQPTDYRGVSELGVIGGIGMLLAFTASITLLPAMLRLFGVDGLDDEMGFARLARVDDFLACHRRRVLTLAGVAAVAALAALPWLRFDFNPLHLRSPETEAVATLNDLARDPATSPNTIDAMSPSLAAARALAVRVSALPEVSRALTLASFIPADQPPKLALIADAALLLSATLEPAVVEPAPTDAETVQALKDAALALRNAVTADPGNAAATDAGRVARLLDALADGPPERRRALDDALIPGLQTTLAQVRASLKAGPVTEATLPPELVADWVTADGRARVEVFPSAAAGMDDDAALQRFVSAVRTVAPEATGTPISIQESATTIVRAFVQAGIWASIAIAILLGLVLRKLRDVLLTLASLVLGGLVTLGLCVVLRIPLNYENIIALPLQFGIGVAFNIYFVIAWRRGENRLLSTSIARAVIFSALTTATAFGTLWLSSHPGTASMGQLLALSLACTLAAALLVLPALLGPPTRITA